jgi:hypothetical protein
MYTEENLENELSFNHTYNIQENKFLILEELKHNITTQFTFQNLGYNYLDDYDSNILPIEIFDWIIEYLNDNYIPLDHILSIYNQIDRIKIIGYSLYTILFVDMKNIIIPRLINSNPTISDLKNIIKELIYELKSIDSILNENTISKQILLKYSIFLDYIDSDTREFEEKYWNYIIINIIGDSEL